jgi:hypothetical protein
MVKINIKIKRDKYVRRRVSKVKTLPACLPTFSQLWFVSSNKSSLFCLLGIVIRRGGAACLVLQTKQVDTENNYCKSKAVYVNFMQPDDT